MQKNAASSSERSGVFFLEATLVDLTNFRSVEGIVQPALFAGDPSPFS
jgi:hypothetical protein